MVVARRLVRTCSYSWWERWTLCQAGRWASPEPRRVGWDEIGNHIGSRARLHQWNVGNHNP